MLIKHKVLSFSKALSLQIHPDKALAEKLHRVDPKRFSDSNHKPEIAVALSKFELFVGWKPFDDIQGLFTLRPLQRYTPEHSHLDGEALKIICKALLEASPQMVSETINELQAIPSDQFGKYSYIPSILGRLSNQYSEFDNGNLVAALLMNYMTIGPGEQCVFRLTVSTFISLGILLSAWLALIT